jgi:hypothetical protein
MHRVHQRSLDDAGTNSNRYSTLQNQNRQLWTSGARKHNITAAEATSDRLLTTWKLAHARETGASAAPAQHSNGWQHWRHSDKLAPLRSMMTGCINAANDKQLWRNTAH